MLYKYNFIIPELQFLMLLMLFSGIKHIAKEKISFIQLLGEGAFGRGIIIYYY